MVWAHWQAGAPVYGSRNAEDLRRIAIRGASLPMSSPQLLLPGCLIVATDHFYFATVVIFYYY